MIALASSRILELGYGYGRVADDPSRMVASFATYCSGSSYAHEWPLSEARTGPYEIVATVRRVLTLS